MKKKLILVILSGIVIALSGAGQVEACFSKYMPLIDKKWDDFYERLENRLLDNITGKYCSVLNMPWESIVMNDMENLSLKHRLEGIRNGKTVSVTYEEYSRPNCKGTFCPFSHCGVYFQIRKKHVQVMLLETKPRDRAPTVLHKKKKTFKVRFPSE